MGLANGIVDVKATLNGELLTANVWENTYPNNMPKGWYFEIVDGGLFEFEGSIKKAAQGYVGVEEFSVSSVTSKEYNFLYEFE